MSAPFHLRPYRTDDEDAAVALWLKTWQQAYPEIDFAARVAWWRERWRNELVPNAAIMIAEQSGQLTGFVTIDTSGYLDQLVVAPDHPLAKQKRVRVRDLDGAPFVAFDRDIPTRRFVDRLLRRHGANVVLTMELDNIETIKRSVEAGIGVSMLPLPALAAEVRAKSLVVKKLDASTIERPLGVLHRKNRELSRGAQVFLKLLAAELGGG